MTPDWIAPRRCFFAARRAAALQHNGRARAPRGIIVLPAALERARCA
jgi:hypothetical protein